jgi:putative oxidoreductase
MTVSVSEWRRRPQSQSLTGTILRGLLAFCRRLPYALVALGLRFLTARVFFLAGQMKIAGPVIEVPLIVTDGTLAVTLPADIRQSTFELFATQSAALPMSPTVAAYLFSYAEFVLPICLVLGFATRLSALALLVMTAMIQAYVAPEALWSAHIYVFALLLVLFTVGPGALSLDAVIRYLYRK